MSASIRSGFTAAVETGGLDLLLQLTRDIAETVHAHRPLENAVGFFIAAGFHRVEHLIGVDIDQRLGGLAGQRGLGNQDVVAIVCPELVGVLSRGVR